MFTLEKIKDDAKFFQLRDEWNNLLTNSASNNIFLTHEWMAIHWRHYKQDNELSIFLIFEDDGSLAGIAPLKINVIDKYGVSIRCLEFLGSDNVASEYLDFIFKSGMEDKCMKILIDYLMSENSWDCMLLQDMYSDSSNYHLLRENTGRHPGFTQTCLSNNCPYIILPESWDSYLSALNRKRRYNMRSREKSLRKKYKVDIIYADENHKTIDESIQRYFELQERRIEDKGISSIVTNKRFQNFHVGIIKSFLANGWLSLTFLKLDGDEAACLYGYTYNKKYYHYQGGFKPELKRYGVGTFIISKQIGKLIENGYQEYDFLRGEEEYKYDWTNNVRKEISFIFYKKTQKNRFIYILDKCKGAVKYNLKKILTRQIM